MFSASSRGAPPRAAGEEGYLVARDDENEKQKNEQCLGGRTSVVATGKKNE